MDNVLTKTGNPADLDYLIDDDGSTVAQTAYATTVGSQGEAYCPLTRTMQIFEDGDWVTFSSSTYPWGYYGDQSASYSRMYFTVYTEAGSTLDGADRDNSVFYLRVKTEDPYSTQSTATVYQEFKVTFNYECQSDYFSLTGVGEQSFQLGSGNVYIYLGWSQYMTLCSKTVSHYYWNNSTSKWDAFSSANFYRGQGDNYIYIGVSSTYYADYRPEVYH